MGSDDRKLGCMSTDWLLNTLETSGRGKTYRMVTHKRQSPTKDIMTYINRAVLLLMARGVPPSSSMRISACPGQKRIGPRMVHHHEASDMSTPAREDLLLFGIPNSC